MIIDIKSGIIHKKDGWTTKCGLVGSFPGVVDTNVGEVDKIFCEECFKEKTPKQNVKGSKQKEMKDEQTDSTTKS